MSGSNMPEYFYAPKVTMFHDIRVLLSSNQIELAKKKLYDVANEQRDAEWNFLMGYVQYVEKNFDSCYIYFMNAASMDKANSEYHAAFEQLNRQQTGGLTTLFNNFFGRK